MPENTAEAKVPQACTVLIWLEALFFFKVSVKTAHGPSFWNCSLSVYCLHILERTNQEAFKGSEDTAQVEVPEACIVLIGFGVEAVLVV